MDAGEVFRELVGRPMGIFAFGIYDAMSARVAQLAGHRCLYVGGYSAAGSRGYPDMGLVTFPEIRDHVKFIARAVKVPLVVDIDDGYGSVHNVIRTVEEIAAIPNVGAIHIEDQRFPKRCGHIAGKEVLPIDEFVGKLRAAVDTRDKVNPSCAVIARTDAFSAAGGKKDPAFGGDIEEAVKRGLAYAANGADLLWCEFPTPDDKSAAAFAEGVRKADVPLAFNISPSFSREEWEVSTLNEDVLFGLGYAFRFSTYPGLLAAMAGVYETARDFFPDATLGLRSQKRALWDSPVESVKKVIGLGGYLEVERRYDPRAAERQASSEGSRG